MANVEPNKWYGMDVISMLLGGDSNKIQAVGESVEEIAKFIKKVNELNSVISTGLDTASAVIQADIEKLTKINPFKETLDALVDEVQTTINDVKGTGVYFLDMNATVPPMWTFGFTMEEVRLQGTIGALNDKVTTLQNKLNKTDSDLREISRLENRARVEQLRFNNVRGSNFGGVGQYARTFNQSLEDQLDFNRPQFSPNAPIAALFIMFGSSSLGQFFKAWESFKSLIKTLKPVVTDGIQPLQRLSAKLVSPEDYDNLYAEQAEYFRRARQTDLDDGGDGEVDAVIVIKNREKNEIEEIRPVIFSEDALENVRNFSGTPLSPSLSDTEAIKKSRGTKIPLYLFENENDRYFSLREIICIVNTKRLEAVGIEETDLYHDGRGKIDYIPGGGAFSFLSLNGIEKWDPDALASTEGNVYLYWQYPKVSNILTKWLTGTLLENETIYVFKKELRADDPFSDLNIHNLNGIPSEDTDTFKIFETSPIGGLRKSYIDGVVKIDEQAEQGIVGYEYAVARGYTITTRLMYGDVALRTFSMENYPIYTVLHNPSSQRSKEIVDKLVKRRNAILNELQELDEPYTTELRETLIEKYGEGNALEIRPVTLSNISQITTPIDYDLSQATPPDWKTFPHLTMIFPQIFNALDNVSQILETLVNYAKDAYDFVPEVMEALKNEADYYLNRIIKIAQALSDIIRSIGDLAAGAYMMVTQMESGGVEGVRKSLSMSLLGNREDVPWKSSHPNAYVKFQAGPPPFGRDDYIGGYCLLAGTADFLLDLVNGVSDDDIDSLVDSVEDDINDIEDDFSDNYGDMSDAADENKDAELPTIDTAVDPNLDDAAKAGYLNGALDALNSGNTPEMAGNLSNSMEWNADYKAAGDATDSLRNYDGTEITDPGLLLLFEALKTGDMGKLRRAAELLLLSRVRIPYELDLFANEEDATAYNNFKLLLAQAIAIQLTGIPLNESQRGVVVETNPFDNVEDKSVSLEKDTYQVGLNVALYYDFDPRQLVSSVYNDSLEALVYNDQYLIEAQWDMWEKEIHNDEWEVIGYSDVANPTLT